MRIMIATVTAGGGHLAAAAALEEAWRAWRPADAIQKVDLVQFFSPLHRKIHEDGYLTLVEHAPELWGMVFKKTDNVKLTQRLNRLKRIFPSNSRARFIRRVKEFNPDAVLCTHYLPLEPLAQLKRRKPTGAGIRGTRGQRSTDDCEGGAKPLVVSIVTDFEAHALWMEGCVDLYCVAMEATSARLVARGVPENNILPTGIPISAKFSQKIEARAAR